MCLKKQWRKNKMEDYKEVFFAIQDAFKAGVEWRKKQMLKGAVDGYVGYDETTSSNGFVVYFPLGTKPKIKHGDKVKIIIIKDE